MRLIGRGSKAASVGVFILLLFPGAPSILCIAPGSHVAIEELNSPCCASSEIRLQPGDQTHDEFAGPRDCNNCTDLFLASNGNGILSKPRELAASSPLAAKCLESCLPDDVSVPLWRWGGIANTGAQINGCAPVPLRC